MAADHHARQGEAPTPRRLLAFVSVCVLACGAATAIWLAGIFGALDQAYLDLQTRLARHERPSDVVIVEIDERTLKELGRWPLPRSHHATLVRKLHAAQVEQIFFDIDFSSRSTPADDAQLASALADAATTTRVILPAFWQQTSADAASLIFTEPLPELRANAQLGLVNLVPGRDGLVRHVSGFSELPDDALPVWQVASPSAAAERAPLPLDYRQAASSFERLSYIDVLNGQALDALKNKTVFVGATALELGDMVAVPVYRALPGIVVQALAHDSARHERLVVASKPSVLVTMIAWTLLAASLLIFGRWRRSPLLAAALIACALMLNAMAYALLNIMAPVSPFIVIPVMTLLGSLLASLSFETGLSWWALRRTRDQNALLRQVFEHSSDALLALDAGAIIRAANPAASTILGRPQASLIGRPLAESAPALVAALHASRPDSASEVWIERSGTAAVAVEVNVAHLEWEQQRISTLTLHDVTTQRAREAELRHLALHDALTGLPNRVSLGKRLEDVLAGRASNDIVALMMLDLDGFKEVNDTLGHSTGDELMRELGLRLRQLATLDRHIARLGGDEFAVLWRVERMDVIGELAQQLLLIIQEPIVIKGIPVSLGTSIGIATCPEHADDAESLLKRADIALYAAKGKHTSVEFYEPGNDTGSPRRLEMLTMLRAAVAKEELFLEYQPKVSMTSGTPVEVEALCRWQNPTFGRVSPGEFIALAEASDVIKPLTEWTIKRALNDCRAWRDHGTELRVAVNLSARHLQDAQLPRWLESTFASTNTRPEWLELEITESAIMTDPDRASRILHALHELGVLLSIDDFGTGYSSLAYLRNLAVNRLKLDRSFIDGMNDSMKDQVIVESTIKLAHGLELEVVAEGIETEFQYQLLRKFGCDLGQGYWIAKPMQIDKLIEWYTARTTKARIAHPAYRNLGGAR